MVTLVRLPQILVSVSLEPVCSDCIEVRVPHHRVKRKNRWITVLIPKTIKSAKKTFEILTALKAIKGVVPTFVKANALTIQSLQRVSVPHPNRTPIITLKYYEPPIGAPTASIGPGPESLFL
jgi:hypothetical protein